MMGFLFGAVAGGLAATYWHAELGKIREQHVPQFRTQAADKVHAAERALVRMIQTTSKRAQASLKVESAPKKRNSSKTSAE